MIVTREISYDVDGLTMVAHLARPDGDGPYPAVLIGHDGIGLDDYQRGRADDLAEHGYIALALDYHAGRTYFGEPDAMLARTMPLLADATRMRAIGHAALDILAAEPGADHDRLAALGYGAGGRIVLELASSGVPFRALAAVHPGLPDARSEDWAGVTGVFLLCTGSADPICPPGALLEFAGALPGADWRVNVYGGAQHAFWAAPSRPDGAPAEPTVPGVGHHPEHAARAWRAVLDLFRETIGAP
jgi:dienelactone hydrolase